MKNKRTVILYYSRQEAVSSIPFSTFPISEIILFYVLDQLVLFPPLGLMCHFINKDSALKLSHHPSKQTHSLRVFFQLAVFKTPFSPVDKLLSFACVVP